MVFKIISDKICVVKTLRGNDKTKDNCPFLAIEKSSQVECVFANDKWVKFKLLNCNEK